MAQQVKNLAWCLWGYGFEPWPHSAHQGSSIATSCSVVKDLAQIHCCLGCGVGLQLQLQFDSQPWNFHMPQVWP